VEAKNIGLNILGVAVLAVLLIEWGARVVLPYIPAAPMMILGVARIFESTALMSIAALFAANGTSAVGIIRGRLMQGVKRGCLWSLGFGMVVAIGYGIFFLFGINLHAFSKIAMPPVRHQAVLLFLVGALISPIAEELFFRGFIYGFFRRWGIIAALVTSTVLFVLAHTLSTGGIPLPQIVGGLLFGIAYEKEKNLLVPIVIHMSGNLALFSIALVFH
jgi:hypothetical protein